MLPIRAEPRKGEAPIVAALFFILQIGFAGFGSFAFAANAEPDTASIHDQPKSRYVGVRRCSLCHDRRAQERADASDNDFDLTEFVSLTEFHTWNTRDKHAKAYRVLTEAAGLQIGKVLGINSSKDKRCLTCHATLYAGSFPPESELRQGVTCESCHGPGSRWLLTHTDPPWRTMTSKEKQQQGMLDLRHPITRAKQCFSCHIGNAGEGKIVTHEMYAAGHPPLPGVEVETFLRAMPPHWTNLNEKRDSIKRLLRYDPKQMYRTKSVVLGGILTLRESLAYLAGRLPAKVAGSWPDFAVYDCYGCHHDLKSPRWRQERGYKGIAGRPQFPDWPHVLVKLAIFHTGRDSETYKKKYQEFGDKLRKVSSSGNAKAFGDTTKVADSRAGDDAIGDLIRWLDELTGEIEASRFDRTSTIRLLHRLTVLKEPEDPDYAAYPDYATARQIAWAMVSLYRDLQPIGDKNTEIEKLFTQMRAVVDLELPGRRPTAAAYNPELFREQVRRVSQLLQR